MPMALFFCFWSQASPLNLFSWASILALLRGMGVESSKGGIEVSFCFFLPLPFGTFLGEGFLGVGSVITIPLVAGLDWVVGVVALSTTLMGSTIIVDTSSLAPHEEEASESFSSLLLLLLSSRMRKWLYSLIVFYFFLPSLEGLVLDFLVLGTTISVTAFFFFPISFSFSSVWGFKLRAWKVFIVVVHLLLSNLSPAKGNWALLKTLVRNMPYDKLVCFSFLAPTTALMKSKINSPYWFFFLSWGKTWPCDPPHSSHLCFHS